MICSVLTCGKPIKTSGLCGAHYGRLLRGTDLTAPLRNPSGTVKPECFVLDCVRIADSSKLGSICAMHRTRQYRNGTYYAARQPANGFGCSITGCHKPRFAVTLCSVHKMRAITYSLSPLQLNQILNLGKCDSCGDPLPLDKVKIDHDHSCCPGERSCGKCVRGLLCNGCNLGLGAFRDSTEKLSKAIVYLLK